MNLGDLFKGFVPGQVVNNRTIENLIYKVLGRVVPLGRVEVFYGVMGSFDGWFQIRDGSEIVRRSGCMNLVINGGAVDLSVPEDLVYQVSKQKDNFFDTEFNVYEFRDVGETVSFWFSIRFCEV